MSGRSLLVDQAIGPLPERAPVSPFPRLCVLWLKIIAGLSIGFVYALKVRTGPSAIFFWGQDAPVLAACVALTAALAAWRWSPARGVCVSGFAIALALALVCLAAGALGDHLVMGDYTLAQDEFLANFDARIFASRRLYAAVPEPWAAHAGALQPIYMLPLPQGRWASGYLPVSAALRALASLGGAESLLNPALGALSIVLVWAIARRLWPEDRGPALVAAALMGTSAQLIVMSMTAYAMSAHLAFNLAWLWLFLRGGRLGHAGAIAVGFLATGLHQIFFHPLFVAPFILQLGLERRWRLTALYAAAYALIGLFWLAWWPVTLRLSGLGGGAAHAAAPIGAWWASRVADALAAIRIDNLGEMGEQLVRFVSWQNPLTAPLALAGAAAALRSGGVMRSLALGFVLTLGMLVLLPSPTHGWGYRYLHGLLGSACLLAAWAWTRLTAGLAPDARRSAGTAFAAACAVSLAVLVPLRAWQTWAYVRPYASADRAIGGSHEEVVVIDHLGRRYFDLGTLNRNGPFLGPGPKVMALSAMDSAELARICAAGPVALFDGDTAERFGVDLAPMTPPPEILALRAELARLRCAHPFVG